MPLARTEIWLHVKTGRLYRIEERQALIEAGEVPAVAYRSLLDGQLWVRPRDEFQDGRFRCLEPHELARFALPEKDEQST